MPTITIHEEVAYKIAQKYPNLDTGEFYLGALAPDAVNLNGFATKKSRWNAHVRNKDLDIWLNNVKLFYKNNKNKYNQNFLLGYILHIITDIVHDKYFYWSIREQMSNNNVSEEEQHSLVRNSMLEYGYQNEDKPFWIHIKEKLKKVEGYDIQNVKKADLISWKNKCFEKHIPSKKTNKYVTKSQITELTNIVEKEFKVFI